MVVAPLCALAASIAERNETCPPLSLGEDAGLTACVSLLVLTVKGPAPRTQGTASREATATNRLPFRPMARDIFFMVGFGGRRSDSCRNRSRMLMRRG